MRVFQTLFNQPSRSYAVTETATAPEQTAEDEDAAQEKERAVRRSQYYSAAQDPRLRREWERMLTASQQQRDRQQRHRKHLSAGAVTNTGPPGSAATANSPTTPTVLVYPVLKEEENDEFFTPQSSPKVSPQTLVQDTGVPLSATAASSEASHRPPVSPTPSEHSYSYAPSVATSSDQYSDFSWGGRNPGSEYTTTTLTSSSRSSRHSRNKTEPGYAASTTSSLQQEEWAKDFRWLVPPEGSSPLPAKRAYSSPSTSTVSSLSSHRQSLSNKTGRSKTEPIRPRPRRKMSEIQEEDVEDGGMNDAASSHDEASQGFDPSSPNQVTAFGELLPARRKSQNRGQPKRPKSLGTYSESISSSVSNRTVDLPTLVPHTEPSTYTSIVFPRAGYQPSKHPERITSAVNIVQQGVASTTMSTISVTKHAAEVLGNRGLSLPRIFKGGNNNLSDTPSHIKNEDAFVGLSSSTPTPSKVQAHQVLVQVFCVALEGLDVLLTREKAKTVDGFGFVPGRGFSGKIVEVGYEVMNLRRGDWVMGLLDVSKCGALSEFVLVDRRRVHRAPVPTPTFSAEHLAVLAVSGVAAYRAVNTLPEPLKDSRVLVLQGHDGAGALAVQELCAVGAEVTVQVPSSDLLEKLRGFKIKAVKVGTPIDVLNALEEGCVDAIVDTVGGRELWVACKRLFGSTGQFTTTVGDVPEAVMSKNAHVKSNMRSLKLAFKSSKKAIGYEWVSASAEVDHEGKDLRDSLAATCGLASEGSIRPRITPAFIIPFERAPEVFNEAHSGSVNDALLQGSVAVIRLAQ